MEQHRQKRAVKNKSVKGLCNICTNTHRYEPIHKSPGKCPPKRNYTTLDYVQPNAFATVCISIPHFFAVLITRASNSATVLTVESCDLTFSRKDLSSGFKFSP